jgi:rhamnosyltransferase
VKAPLVSILIPTLNGMEYLPQVFQQLTAQKVSFDFETVAVDSGSTDGTVAFLRTHADRVSQIDPNTFNHGLSRNYGIQQCRGEFVVLLVQDATPASKNWLAELLKPMLAETQIAGCYARQRPRATASAITRHYLAGWVACQKAPRRSTFSNPSDLLDLEPMEQFLACVFDNVCSVIRKSVWEQYCFRETSIAEDLAWSKEVLLAGLDIVYTPEAQVVHSHDRSAGYEFRRTFLVHQRLYDLFGLQTIGSLRQLARAIAVSLPLHLRCLIDEPNAVSPRAYWRGVALALALPLGQYLGAATEARGWHFIRIGGA